MKTTTTTLAVLGALGLHGSVAQPEAIDCTAAATLGLWEQHVCGQPASVAPECQPLSFRAAEGVAVKGAVLLFHGYSACPDSVAPMAEHLQQQGFHVYLPLTVGHGRAYLGNNVAACEEGLICVQGDNVSELPTTIDAYSEFTREMVRAFKESAASRGVTQASGLQRGVGGLSLGGALATFALIEDREEGFFTRGLRINPFYGITVPQFDRDLQGCLDGYEECLANLISAALGGVVEQFGGDAAAVEAAAAPDGATARVLSAAVKWLGPNAAEITQGYLGLQNLVRFAMIELVRNEGLIATLGLEEAVNGPFGWGSGCADQRDAGRNGYCNFRILNLLAAHGFGQTTMALAHVSSPAAVSGHVFTERDGVTRNSLNMFVARAPLLNSGADTKVCMYRSTFPLCSSNDCGVPHSLLSRPENLVQSPFTLYWEQPLFADVARFFATGDLGVPAADERELSSCYLQEDLRRPDESLFGVVPIGAILTIALTEDLVDGRLQLHEIAESIARQVSADPGYVVSVLGRLAQDRLKAFFRLELPDMVMARAFADKVAAGEVSVGDQQVVALRLETPEKVVEVTAPFSAAGEGAALPPVASVPLGGVAAAAGGAVVAVLAVAALAVRHRRRKQQQQQQQQQPQQPQHAPDASSAMAVVMTATNPRFAV